MITTQREYDYIVISVKDNGVGIEANNLDNIFSKYFRVEHSIEGSGLGLYLLKEIVNNSGGHIAVESEVGRGSIFTVYLKGQ